MERTLVISKPDALQRGLVGEIIRRFERKGIKIVAMKMMRFDEALLREHYAHHVDKHFFSELSEFMRSSPVVVFVLEGPGAVEMVRKIAGTSADDLGSIRGDFSSGVPQNIIHSSDSAETAKKEIQLFFQMNEIFDYKKDEWKHVFSEFDE